MAEIAGVDPRTGTLLPAVAQESTAEQVAEVVASATRAATSFAILARSDRASLLERIAGRIDASAEELVLTAMHETGFAEAKLRGEIARASYQFRFFAEVVREGSYLEIAIDHAGKTPAGPQPDLRRTLVPLGPVAVFGASNFPFAFSALGGDTASALAAGNPVVVKAHASHPATSLLSYAVLEAGLQHDSVDPGVIGLVHGLQAGVDLVTHPDIKAAGFTGSLGGGQALLEAISAREEPIPFYGELSSINPVIVTPNAAADRASEIGTGYAASLAMGAGQLCTKPGFLLAPTGPEGDELVAQAAKDLSSAEPHVLLNAGIHRTFHERIEEFSAAAGVATLAGQAQERGPGFRAVGALFEVPLDRLDAHLVHEVFGPVSVVVRYPPDEVVSASRRLLELLPASLTVTLHVTDDDGAVIAELTPTAVAHSGRIVFNGFPTGVSVSWAQTHGGPWPSTNTVHTSVGATALRRFLRPVTFQNSPVGALPLELRDDYSEIPRRVDGVLRVPGPTA